MNYAADFSDNIQGNPICACDTCDWKGHPDKLGAISDVDSRLTPGSVVPAGECPECGALTYIEPDTSDIPEAGPAFFEGAKLTLPARLDSRQLGTVLAALRFWQFSMGNSAPGENHPIGAEFAKIATDDWTALPLDAAEIDALCKRLKFSEPQKEIMDEAEAASAAVMSAMFPATTKPAPAYGTLLEGLRAIVELDKDRNSRELVPDGDAYNEVISIAAHAIGAKFPNV